MFRESLPPDCPPDDAEVVSSGLVVYRLVAKATPTEGDFDSERAKYPNKKFNTDECHALGVSVFTDCQDAGRILKLPLHIGERICSVLLEQDSGYIHPNGRYSHNTWWPLADYDILGSSRVL